MEENAVELFDYLRVIWKRKILIIVVTLVCIGVGAGVGVTNSRSKLKLPVKYNAEVVIKIGKKVNLTPFTGVASSVGYIRSPVNLVTIIPLKYWPKVKGTSGYHLEVEQVGPLGMLKIIIKGHDKGVERGLEELVDMLIDEHRVLAEISIVAYENLLRKLEEDSEKIKKEIVLFVASLRKMRKKEEDYLVGIGTTESEAMIGSDRSAFLNMLYLKTIDKERELSRARGTLRSIQTQVFTGRLTLGNIAEYKTEKFGEIRNTTIKPKEEEERYKAIAVGGVAGLIMSLFIAFFIEYIEESKSRRKGK
jgi:hypothetical protein